MCPEHCGNEDQQEERSSFLEEVKNIENRVAWFLAELCKGEKGMQKDKRNKCRTDRAC